MAQLRPVVISGPSGSGKSTLLKAVMEHNSCSLAFSVSHTTRNPRPGETAGIHYHYVSRDEFGDAIETGHFVEHTEFSGNLYGTSKAAIQKCQDEGKICVLDLDVVGVQNMKKSGMNPVYIFVQPPDRETLEARLRGRGTETEESIARRLATFDQALEFAMEPGNYDHVIVNNDLHQAVGQLKSALERSLNLELQDENHNGGDSSGDGKSTAPP